jgi:formylglycine-generating enzyme required for sulfatase activity
MVRVFEAGQYRAVVKEISQTGAAYRATTSGPKLEGLRTRASERLAEIARADAEREERARRIKELLRLADEELKVGDHVRALELLVQARAIDDTDDVARRMALVRRMRHVERARADEKAGKLEDAVRFYELALGIRDEAELRAHVERLRNLLALNAVLAKARGHVEARRWEAARRAYLEALGAAPAERAKKIRDRIREVERHIEFAAHMEAARTHAASGNWDAARAAARAAATVDPQADEPRQLIQRADRALGSPQELKNSLGMRFVLVPGGGFVMGSDDGPADERPSRTVRLRSFYMGRLEVSNAQFEAFRPAHRARRTKYSHGDQMPVVAVRYADAAAFCRWLSGREGVTYRLPTEAEWEKAARGDDGRRYPWGDESPDASGAFRCNFAPARDQAAWGKDGSQFAAPVSRFASGASPYGCLNMAGNVWEWVSDWYGADYYRTAPNENPGGPERGTRRVVRGGSFVNGAGTLRCTNRRDVRPNHLDANVGFRCVREMETPEGMRP